MSVFHVTVTGFTKPKGAWNISSVQWLMPPYSRKRPGKHLLVSFYWDFRGTGGTATMRKPDIEKSSVDRKREVML